MNPEVGKEWIAALRSGEFSQGKDALQSSSGKFCCLGVLCEMYRQKHPEKARWDKCSYAPSIVTFVTGNLCEDHCLLEVVQDWAGMRSMDGTFIDDGIESTLSFLNDSGTPFSEIADIIEANMESL